MNFDKIYDYATGIGCKAQKNVPMSRYTTFRIGGDAALMITPQNDEQLSAVIAECKKESIKPFILGNGSNMLICDEGLDTVVINMCRDNAQIHLEGEDVIVCDAGATMSRVCNFALENGLTGLEFAFGIPGSAGGAAYMNAGAYGGEMKDVLFECEHIEPNGTCGRLKGEELGLDYRTSAYEHNGFIITKLFLKLKKGDKNDIKAKMQELLQRRKDKQPLEYPSAGSTFKRPVGYFAGGLIEECGLKGYSVGGAQVSEKHAGFVINKGGATAKDVLDLIKYVQDKVYVEKGVMLEPEIRLIKK